MNKYEAFFKLSKIVKNIKLQEIDLGEKYLLTIYFDTRKIEFFCEFNEFFDFEINFDDSFDFGLFELNDYLIPYIRDFLSADNFCKDIDLFESKVDKERLYTKSFKDKLEKLKKEISDMENLILNGKLFES